MLVVLIRHAQKDFLPPEDPGLNEKGQQQAQRLFELIHKKNLPTPTELWCSTKIRTKQTLVPMAEELSLGFFIKDELNLRSYQESLKDFRFRLQKIINELTDQSKSKQEQNIFLCTHYDVIEELMTLIPCDKDLTGFEFSHWAPSQFVIFELSDLDYWKFIKIGSAS